MDPPPIAIVMVVMAASAPTQNSRIRWGIAPGGPQNCHCIETSLGCCVTRAMLDFSALSGSDFCHVSIAILVQDRPQVPQKMSKIVPR